MTNTQPRLGGIEVRSIDYVPLNERHGRVWHLGPLWFMSNAQIATLAVGLISISEGASLFWSVLAIVIGTLVGTLFMAFHSAQGPQLGLPQMIQSRPQFGYLGALLVWLFAYVQYAGLQRVQHHPRRRVDEHRGARQHQAVGDHRHRGGVRRSRWSATTSFTGPSSS